eukprot:CAMPEP_0172302500 /NCGR_PEP_ID=MMETSP1058-20130122/4196_1 /TAXON_ID=83371 /ORGANISM="Detonula confervacea, Strain CCMP 353" /LENGTH=663 /DNA_ID=CAMNT_0013013007 /DNA_START=68 /DNA_END=2059 /DNA_ORIENTATION=-
MSSGSLVFTAEAPSSSSINKTNDDNSNRLAPYNPTHATAQSTALDLLALTPHDVFFDLGCGDGRLVIAALEKCYDDDYLMRVHQERFARLHLPSRWEMQQSQYDATTPTSTDDSRKIRHSRSCSTDYSVPHLMRTSSNDDYSDTSGFDSSPYHHRRVDGSHGRKEYGSNDHLNGGDDEISESEDESEHGSVDFLSALSPASQRKMPCTPASPITPIACNRGPRRLNVSGINGTSSSSPAILGQPPSLSSAFANNATPIANNANNNNNNNDHPHTPKEKNEFFYSIPKTISTPSPNDRRSRHASQISELPMVESFADHVDDQSLLSASIPLTSVPSGELMRSLSGGILMSVPSGDVMFDDDDDDDDDDDGGEHGNSAQGWMANINDNAGEGAAAKVATEAAKNNAAGGVQKVGGGLQCVGIEYNQALAETAQANVQKSYIYPHVERKVCIRWGDVLEEWNANVGGGDKGCGNDNIASELNLIEDATAVFVYLLPQGLKKVKPLLYEAAVLRWRQQERQKQQQQEKEQKQRQQQQLKQPHPLQQYPLHETENLNNTSSTEYYGESFPLPRQLVHRKGYSHLSDITDYDFRTSNSSSTNNSLQRTILEESDDDGVVPIGNENFIPSFRVVSYMFSIPGWTPVKVDRSSKGSCPLYLYENIHEEKND